MVYLRRWLLLGVVGSMFLATAAPGLARLRPAGPAAPGTVNMPYNMPDTSGNNWHIQQNGSFRQQNNQPLYSAGGQALLNGSYFNPQSNRGRLEEKTGELILENMAGQGCTLTRRISVMKEDGALRIVDIIRNTQNQEVTLNYVVQSQFNYGITGSQTLVDPRIKTQSFAWLGQTSLNNRAVLEIFNGRGAKVAAQVQYQQGNSHVQAAYNLTIPAGKEVALVHVHHTAMSMDTAGKWAAALRETKLLADVPAAIRKLVVNFRSGVSFVGDAEVLRGETSDVIELRGGDMLRGTLKPAKYAIKTFYGPVELPADRVVGLINVGEHRPRQLLVTQDGEIFGGQLEETNLAMELSSGQVAEVPLIQVARAGYRKRANEPEEWTFDKPLVLMRSGERMSVQMPTADLEVLTRYGSLKLKPEIVAAIAFQAEGHGVHQVMLSDGSRFAGLVGAQSFEMKLVWGQQTVKFPASALSRLQLSGKEEETDESVGTLSLANEDLLAGGLVGQLKLDTAFSTLGINAAEIKRLSRGKGSVQDVTVELWDQTSVSGQLQEGELTCRLKCGVEMKVPVGLVEEYVQPRPSPSAAAAQQIVKLAEQLGAEDWAARDEAQKKLTQMGVVVIGVLKEIRPKQSAEGQQRIDQIIKEVERTDTTGKAGATTVTPPPALFNKD
jgi:hypothetical protein